MAAGHIDLDNTDWKILEALQANARATFTEIGQTAGLTAPAVRERIRRMEDYGLITAYKPVINYAALGRSIHAIIIMKVKPGSKAAQYPEFDFSPLLRGMSGVIRTCLVTGDIEWLVEVCTETMDELNGLLANLTGMGFVTITCMVLSDSGQYDCSVQKK